MPAITTATKRICIDVTGNSIAAMLALLLIVTTAKIPRLLNPKNRHDYT